MIKSSEDIFLRGLSNADSKTQQKKTPICVNMDSIMFLEIGSIVPNKYVVFDLMITNRENYCTSKVKTCIQMLLSRRIISVETSFLTFSQNISFQWSLIGTQFQSLDPTSLGLRPRDSCRATNCEII